MKNQLRIIGGEWKRRVLPFASINGLRPTPDRVRETLVNWLMWEIPNATVLDVCTGSGALAFEALSRGASSVLMIEPDSTQAKINAQHCELKVATAQHILPKLNQQFDVVFLDPPYALELWQELSILIDPLLKDQAYIYVEADRDLRQVQLPASWQLVKSTKAGTVRAGLFQKT